MGANAVEIMTQGTVIDTQFSNEHIGSDLADPIFLRWRSLINFRDKIFVCHVQQMVLHDVDHAPSASCIEAS
jgi:hypothetical protein